MTNATAPTYLARTSDRGQEAGVRASAASRRDLCGRHARFGADRTDRPYRPLPRTGNLCRRGIFLQGAERSARAAGNCDFAGAGDGKLRRRGCRPTEGAWRDIRLVSLVGAPEGIERMRGIHPDVPIWLAAIDKGLDETPTFCRALAMPATAPMAPNRLTLGSPGYPIDRCNRQDPSAGFGAAAAARYCKRTTLFASAVMRKRLSCEFRCCFAHGRPLRARSGQSGMALG